MKLIKLHPQAIAISAAVVALASHIIRLLVITYYPQFMVKHLSWTLHIPNVESLGRFNASIEDHVLSSLYVVVCAYVVAFAFASIYNSLEERVK